MTPLAARSPRARLRRAGRLLWAAVLLGGSAVVAQPRSPAPNEGVDFVADLVARTFVRGLFDGNVAELGPLVADRVSFDGELVQGAAVRERLALVARRARAAGQPRRLVLMTFAKAQARFGEPPSRLRAIGLPGTVIGFARLDRGGLITIVKKVDGRWKVAGLSD